MIIEDGYRTNEYNWEKKLTDYFVRENHIDISCNYVIENVLARDLICPERFDLMAKWIYIDAYDKGIDISHAMKIYSSNINSFSCGSFTEPGTEKKNSLDEYIRQFNNLIEDIRNNGFDKTKSLIPVGKDNIICDGAHRIAVAAYYDKEVTIIRFPDLERNYNYDYFRKYLMNDIEMGYMAAQYAHLINNCYMACLWPVADRTKLNDVSELVKKTGKIIYEQDVYLTYRGMCNFMSHIYGHQSWTGSIEDHFSGVSGKANCCFDEKYPTHTYLFCASNLEEVLELKKHIRDLYDLGNHSIHISDDQAETNMMVELLYNPNSVQVLNHAQMYKYSMVFNHMTQIKETIKSNDLNINRFIIDSSAVMEVCGIREAKDVDFLTDYLDENISNEIDGVDNHNSQLPYYQIAVKDMLYNPKNYFFFNGMKFLAIHCLIEMKKKRNEPKDIADVRLCSDFTKRFKKIPKKYRYDTIEMVNRYQISNHDYGHGPLTYNEYKLQRFKRRIRFLKLPFRIVRKYRYYFNPERCAARRRLKWIRVQREQLHNKDMSIISSNCNGGVLSSDLGLQFRSPFVNLFIQASDYVRLLQDLRGYMDEPLRFVKEDDPIYGAVNYPTAYLRDVKIYFMHYHSVIEAEDAWNRRKERINWDNLYILFTDRSQCTQKDLEDFDKLPYEHKVVFTHIPHSEIKSAFYIRGYENDEKVPVLSAFENENYPVKRIYDQFDFVRWFNGD